MKKSVSVVLLITIIFVLSFTLISANVFEDLLRKIFGEDGVKLSPSGVDNYCAQVGGYDLYSGEKTSSGYGISDEEMINCFSKLNDGEILSAPNKGEDCYDYVCALYRGTTEGLLSDSIIDKKCARENGWPIDGVNGNCLNWCPLGQGWNVEQGRCALKIIQGSSSICGNNVLEGNEQCDMQKLNGQTCLTKGYDGGVLSCYPAGNVKQCEFDTDGCIRKCGDGFCESSESISTCPSDCKEQPKQAVCGNYIKEAGEFCEIDQTRACSVNNVNGIQRCTTSCSGWGVCETHEQTFDCEVRNPKTKELMFWANDNELMYSKDGYYEKHLLCFNNEWYEEGTIDNWYIDPVSGNGFEAKDVSICEQVGGWYVSTAYDGSDETKGIWTKGIVPESCGKSSLIEINVMTTKNVYKVGEVVRLT